jgi:CBS domain containing-hemolysin-like protein
MSDARFQIPDTRSQTRFWLLVSDSKYPSGMSTGKLILLTIGWVLASLTIGIVVGVFLTEILVLVGLVDTGSTEYSISLNVIALSAFAVVVVVPLVFRTRFRPDKGDEA